MPGSTLQAKSRTTAKEELFCMCVCSVASVLCVLCDPMDGSPPGSSVQARKKTWVCCHAVLQRIFPTQGSNLRLLHLPALVGGFITTSATWETLSYLSPSVICLDLHLRQNCTLPQKRSSVLGGWDVTTFISWVTVGLVSSVWIRPSGAEFASVQCKKHLSIIWIVHDRRIICWLSCLKEIDRSLPTEIWDEFLKLWISTLSTCRNANIFRRINAILDNSLDFSKSALHP